jgi:class 3 adenylate cyclase
LPNRRHVPIQPYLTALFSLITLAIGLSTAGLFYERMKAASIKDARANFDRVSANVAQQLLQVRLEIQDELALVTGTPLAKAKTWSERVAAKDDLIPLLNVNSLVSEAFVGYPNGDYIRFSRVLSDDDPPPSLHGATAYVMHTVQIAGGKFVGRYWFYDKQRKLLAVVNRKTTFDARGRPWYQTTPDGVTVTAPFVFASTFDLGYSVSKRARGGGVFAADVDIAATPLALGKFLPTPSAVAAGIRSDSGVVFALSDGKLIAKANFRRTTPATVYQLGFPPLAAAFSAARPPFMEASGSYTDPGGRVWLYRVTPARDADGNVSRYPLIKNGRRVDLPRAVLVLTAPEDEIIANATRVRDAGLILSGVLLVAMIPVAYWFSQLISRPLGRLRGDALALRHLDFSERPRRTSAITELDEFSETFGTMRSHIREHNAAVANFIPRQFLELLGHRDLRSLQLGDHCESAMTMLFSDIRAFTTLSGSMTPAENFRFVNSYLSHIGPIVREQNGFIDKYIGDGIFALFPTGSGDALDAAVAMQRRVVTYNEGRARAGYAPIAIGIGLHRGNLMLGTIGESLRFETTVISDAVNIAARMEGLTKTFGALILASGEVLEHVDRAGYRTRNLGEVLVKGAVHAITVYEICDADPFDLLGHKMRTNEAFERARLAYAFGKFKEAERLFRDIAASDERDDAAAYFRDRAAIMASAIHVVQWDGVEHMESK